MPQFRKYEPHIRWFLDRLYTLPRLDKKVKRGWVHCSAELLRQVLPFRQYKYILADLVDVGIIEREGNYAIGKECRKFRLTKAYRQQSPAEYVITHKCLLKKITKVEELLRQRRPLTDLQQYLFDCVKRLTVDTAHLPGNLSDKVMLAIEFVNSGRYFMKPDKYGRIHTNLTTLKRDVRRDLLLDGIRHHLTLVDVKNSQPLFLCLLLLKELFRRKKEREGGKKEVGSLSCDNSQALQSNLPGKKEGGREEGSEGSLSCDILAQGEVQEDVKRFVELCVRGKLYEFLMMLWKVKDRNKVKKMVYSEVLFCRATKVSVYDDLFRKEFPTVWNFAQRLKCFDYRVIAHRLQKMESTFIFSVVKNFLAEYPGAWVGTIHDSILVQDHHGLVLLKMMRDEFKRYGIAPVLNLELVTRPAERPQDCVAA